MANRFLLGGGIGSGKSAAAAIFAAMGAHVISSDDAGRRVLAPGSPATAEVLTRWPEVDAGDGTIARSALGRIVFADPDQLAALEAITHPGIRDVVLAEAAASDAAVVMVEVPILRDLYGPGWELIVVDAPEEVRIERVVARDDGASEASVRDVIARQPGRGEWLTAARFVIDNSGDLADLREQCERVWGRITTA